MIKLLRWFHVSVVVTTAKIELSIGSGWVILAVVAILAKML